MRTRNALFIMCLSVCFSLAANADADSCAAFFQKPPHSAIAEAWKSQLQDGHWQEVAWRALDRGDATNAQAIEAQIAQHLKTAALVKPLEIVNAGSSMVYKVQLADNVSAIFKPSYNHWKRQRVREFHDLRMPEKEVAAFAFDRAVGANLIPVTVLRDIDGMHGSLQIFVETENKAIETHSIRNEKRLKILDYIMGTWDRVPNNILHVRGGIAAIDNAMTFLEKTPHRAHGIHPPPFASEFERDREAYLSALSTFKISSLGEFDSSVIEAAERDLLADSEIAAALARSRELVKILKGN